MHSFQWAVGPHGYVADLHHGGLHARGADVRELRDRDPRANAPDKHQPLVVRIAESCALQGRRRWRDEGRSELYLRRCIFGEHRCSVSKSFASAGQGVFIQNGSFGSHAAARYVAATTQACCDAVMESAGKGGAEVAVAKSTIAFAANDAANETAKEA